MLDVRLRPFRADDLAVFARHPAEPGSIDFFGFRPTNGLARRFAENGLLGEDDGSLVVDVDGDAVGGIGWHAVHHGPGSIARALNIGIELFAEQRGRGYGTVAQSLIAEHLFATTLIERLEATTDVENVAEQRALVRAGYTREGVLRHTQWRDGAWRDNVIFSRLRGD